MSKLFLWIAAAAMSAVLAVVVAKSQVDPSGSWGWVLKDPHVVPALLTVAVVCVLIGLGQLKQVRRVYWMLFFMLFGDDADATIPSIGTKPTGEVLASPAVHMKILEIGIGERGKDAGFTRYVLLRVRLRASESLTLHDWQLHLDLGGKQLSSTLPHFERVIVAIGNPQQIYEFEVYELAQQRYSEEPVPVGAEQTEFIAFQVPGNISILHLFGADFRLMVRDGKEGHGHECVNRPDRCRCEIKFMWPQDTGMGYPQTVGANKPILKRMCV